MADKNEVASGKTFTLTNDQTGDKWVLPVFDGSIGPSTIDIRALYEETGHFTLDPSFTSTASCRSRITFIVTKEFFCTADTTSKTLQKKVILLKYLTH